MSPGVDRPFGFFGAQKVAYIYIHTCNLKMLTHNTYIHTQAVQSVYSQFLSLLFALVEGTIDNSKFEDQCRALLGNKVRSPLVELFFECMFVCMYKCMYVCMYG